MAIRQIQNSDQQQVFNLVENEFNLSVAPDFTPQGSTEFFKSLKKMLFQQPANLTVLVAESDNSIIGMIAIRDDGHICLFFVKKAMQGKGWGRKLMMAAEACVLKKNSRLTMLDVNSSLYAVQAYTKLGFIAIKEKQVMNGIVFVPMEKLIAQATT